MTAETEPFRDDTELAARYQFLEKLGEGGTGMVYRARRWDLPECDFALKVLVGAARTPLNIWQSSSELLTGLEHPHLVKVFACGQLGDAPYLEMELLTGGTLRQSMTSRIPWPTRQALLLLIALGEALAYLHERGLLHLDLKPENVLLSPEGHVKLADLDGVVPRGLGRLTWERGSPDYCPPEQRFGLPVDERADVFALASVGYELLTGKLPGRVFVPCTTRNSSLPEELNGVFCAGLARDPHDRPATMVDFVRLLRAVLHS